MLNKPSALRMVSGIFFAAFFSLSVTALTFKEIPPGATVPAVPAEPPVSSDTAVPETAAAPPGKVVYKSIDSKGQVTFTSSPPADRPSEAVQIKAANTMPVGLSASSQASGATEQKPGAAQYTLTITSPANDELFGQDVESVTLAAQLDPGLQEGNTFQLYYDGKPVGNGAMSYTVTELERGTHTVEAKVFDSKKKLLKAAEPVRFTVRRISALNKLTVAQLSSSTGNTKPVAPPPSGFGAPKGAGSSGGSNSASDAGSLGGAGSSGDANSAKGSGASIKK